MLKGILISAALMLAWSLVQVAVFHLFKPRRAFNAMVLCFLPAAAAFLVIYPYTPADLGVLGRSYAGTPFWLGYVNGLLCLVLLFLTCAMFYFHVERSLSLRLLVEFDRSPGRCLTEEGVRRMFDLGDVIRPRIDAMVANRFLVERDGRYRLTVKGRIGAWSARVFQFFFKMKPF